MLKFFLINHSRVRSFQFLSYSNPLFIHHRRNSVHVFVEKLSTYPALISYRSKMHKRPCRGISRLFSNPSSTETLAKNIDLLSPDDFLISMPKNLSPSSANEFRNCPQSFLFQYLFGIKQPPNLSLAKGSICHKSLELVFDLKPEERTLINLQNILRKSWSKERLSKAYCHLFDEKQEEEGEPRRDIEAERVWGRSALKLLENYFELEDSRLVPRPNPLEREVWVKSNLTLDSNNGVTGHSTSENPKSTNESPTNTNESNTRLEDSFLVRGIVDRIDLIGISPSSTALSKGDRIPKMALRIIDYKTGKAPNFKYSQKTNERIADENMWQLKIYALLIREMDADGKKVGNLGKASGIDLRLLRLMYLTSEKGSAQNLDMDLGSTQEERNVVLQKVHSDLSEIWRNISTLVEKQDPKAFVHCDRSWCHCHRVRPKFMKGTLWEKS